MTKPIQSKNAADITSVNSIQEIHLQEYSTTKGRGGRNASRLRAALDYVLSPLWVSIPRNKGRLVFHILSYLVGGGKIYGSIAASYLRFLATKGTRV